MKKLDKTKRKIINSLSNRKVINIKICKCVKKNSYEMQIGDSQNMDLVDAKGSTGFSNFYKDVILREISSEMDGL